MRELLWIAIGGAAGSVARYGVFRAFSGTVGTLVANVTGAFILGFVIGAYSHKMDPVIGVGITVGLLGGYTTFSTWMLDSVELWRDGQIAAASVNVGVAVLLGLAAAGAGVALGLAVDNGRPAV